MTEIARKKEKGFAAFAYKLIEKLMGLVYFEYNGHQLFYAGFFLYYLGRAATDIYWPGMSPDYHFFFALILKIIRYFAYILCFAQIILNDFRTRHFIRLAAALSILGVQVILSGGSEYATIAIVILAAYDSDPREIVKYGFIIRTFILFGNLLLSATGITWDYISGNGIISKLHFMGFHSLNHASYVSIFWGLEYLYLKGGYSFFDALFVLGICELTSLLNDTKTTIILTPLIVISGVIVKYWKYRKKPSGCIRKLFIISPFVFCVFIFVLYSLYNEGSSFWSDFDKKIMHHRLFTAKEVFDRYPITLFGAHPHYEGFNIENLYRSYTYNYIDGAYGLQLITSGIFFLVLVLLLYSYLMYKSYEINDIALSTVVFWMVFLAMSESFPFDPAFNVFIYLPFCSFKERTVKRRFYW